MPAWDVRFDLRLNLGDPVLQADLIEAIARARVIRDYPVTPAVRERLRRINIQRAVHSTTAIEGTMVSIAEVEAILDDPQHVLQGARRRDELEVRNAASVFDYITAILSASPDQDLTEGHIAEFHRRMTAGIDYPNNEPGRYRHHGVTAGTYVPPRDHDSLQRLMAEFTRWLNSGPASRWPPVVRAVAAHFYFISIHPFGDGNGRTARAIESFLLAQGGFNQLRLSSLSNFYYRNRERYVAMLDHTRFASDGDLTPFVRFAVAGLVEELEHLYQEVLAEARKIAFREFARDTLSAAPRMSGEVRDRLFRLVLALGTDEPADRMPRPADVAVIYGGLSAKTLSRDMQVLERLGILRRQDGRLWAAIGRVGPVDSG